MHFLPKQFSYGFHAWLYMDVWQVPVHEEDPLTMYRVEVKTSDIWVAVTDTEVVLNINGIKDGKVRRLSGAAGMKQHLSACHESNYWAHHDNRYES